MIPVLLTAALLAAIAMAQLVGGPAWLPSWMGNLMRRVDADPLFLLRLIAGCEIALSMLLLALRHNMKRSRGFPSACAGVVAFIALAQCSSVLTQATRPGAGLGDLLIPLTTLIVAVLLTWRLGSVAVIAREPKRGPSIERIISTAVVCLLIGLTITGRVPVGNSSVAAPMRVVELDTASWSERTIPESGLGLHLPQLTALTLEGKSIIVFYDPRCGRCHELFAEYFNKPRAERIIAVKVPPARDAVLVESDQPQEIDCPDCIKLDLPAGPAWLLTPPVVAVVEDGRINCVAERDYEACLGAPTP